MTDKKQYKIKVDWELISYTIGFIYLLMVAIAGVMRIVYAIGIISGFNYSRAFVWYTLIIGWSFVVLVIIIGSGIIVYLMYLWFICVFTRVEVVEVKESKEIRVETKEDNDLEDYEDWLENEK